MATTRTAGRTGRILATVLLALSSLVLVAARPVVTVDAVRDCDDVVTITANGHHIDHVVLRDAGGDTKVTDPFDGEELTEWRVAATEGLEAVFVKAGPNVRNGPGRGYGERVDVPVPTDCAGDRVGALEVRLSWTYDAPAGIRADNDLVVAEPGGTSLWLGASSASGGMHTGDALCGDTSGTTFPAGSTSGTDVEAVRWAAGAPAGSYGVEVYAWGACPDATAGPWHLTVVLDGVTLLDETGSSFASFTVDVP